MSRVQENEGSSDRGTSRAFSLAGELDGPAKPIVKVKNGRASLGVARAISRGVCLGTGLLGEMTAGGADTGSGDGLSSRAGGGGKKVGLETGCALLRFWKASMGLAEVDANALKEGVVWGVGSGTEGVGTGVLFRGGSEGLALTCGRGASNGSSEGSLARVAVLLGVACSRARLRIFLLGEG